MTQNFNLDSEPKHRYSNGDFSHHYSKGEFQIFIKADAKNNIFKINYTTPTEFEVYFENIANFIQDKNLDDLIKGSSFSFYSSINCNELDEAQQFYLEVALLHMREALYLYRGDLRSISHIESDQLICRCMGVDSKMFKELFKRTEGKKLEIFKEGQVSMICGECSQLVGKTFNALVSSEEIFEGETFSQWSEKISGLLQDFHFYSPKEFGGAQIILEKVNLPEVEINLVSKDSELTEQLARTSLANFLGQELGIPLDIKISFGSSFSTD